MQTRGQTEEELVRMDDAERGCCLILKHQYESESDKQREWVLYSDENLRQLLKATKTRVSLFADVEHVLPAS